MLHAKQQEQQPAPRVIPTALSNDVEGDLGPDPQ